MTWPKGYKPPLPDDNATYVKENEKIVCRNCNNNNPLNSRYCNKCGAELSFVCLICGNINNQIDSNFCNQCGSPIKRNKNDNNITISAESLFEKKENFLWFVSPEYNFKIQYPLSWRKIEKQELNTYPHRILKKEVDVTEIVRFEPKEIPLKSTDISISTQIKQIKMSLDNFVILSEYYLKFHNPNTVFLESVKTTLGGFPAHCSVYEEEGRTISVTYTIISNIVFLLVFGFEAQYYKKYVSKIDKMVKSFEFLKAPLKSEVIAQPSRNKFANQEFIEFISLEYNIKMKYPSNWLEFYRPTENILVMFKPIESTLFPNTPDSFQLCILKNGMGYRNIKEYAKVQIKELKNESNSKITNESFVKIAKLSAFQVIVLANENKFLIVSILKDEKIFRITYIARRDNYEKYIRIVRQIIDSFEFF